MHAQYRKLPLKRGRNFNRRRGFGILRLHSHPPHSRSPHERLHDFSEGVIWGSVSLSTLERNRQTRQRLGGANPAPLKASSPLDTCSRAVQNPASLQKKSLYRHTYPLHRADEWHTARPVIFFRPSLSYCGTCTGDTTQLQPP